MRALHDRVTPIQRSSGEALGTIGRFVNGGAEPTDVQILLNILNGLPVP